MTQEIKLKLEQAAESVVMKLYYGKPSKGSSELNEFNEFKSVAITLAQTILENPSEWGLCSIDQHAEYFGRLQSQLTKYRGALERIIVESEDNEQVGWMYVAGNMVEIAKEALKQEEE